MGKRSNFEHNDLDFYPTPAKAVLPLLPYLRGVRNFAEPCAGNGDLVNHLESHGLRCVYQGDIRTGQDALATADYGKIDAIVTNPPYDTEHQRKLMHAMILHFQRIAPTWLLLCLDWVSNLQAAPFLPQCSDIVIIGRVKWIAGTKKNGMENFGWFRFDAKHKGATVIHNNRGQAAISRRTQACAHCRKPYEPRRTSSRFCSDTCRQRAHRLSVTASVTLPEAAE